MATTPSGAQIWAERPDGSRVDVTEAVQVLYDTVLSSMDFGSGFLSDEEVIPAAELAEVCGFDNAAPRRYLEDLTRFLRPEYTSRYGPNVQQGERAKAWLDAHPEISGDNTAKGDAQR